MMLATISNSVQLLSPVAHILQDKTPVALAGVRDSVGIADLSGIPLAQVRAGDLDAQVPGVPASPGDVSRDGDTILARLRGDMVLMLGDSDLASKNTESLLSVTDITHGRGHFLLVGNDAPQVLAKICGLDFSDSNFPDMHAATSSVAKVRTTIIRCDREGNPAYHLIMGRSLAAYMWGVVFDAMGEFGGSIVDLSI